MLARMNLAIMAGLLAGFLSSVPIEAKAACATDDYICEKFSRIDRATSKSAAVRRAATVRRSVTKSRARPTTQKAEQAPSPPVAVEPIRTSMNAEIAATAGQFR